MKPEIWEFLRWQIGIGIAFFGAVFAYLTWSDKRRRNREEDRAKLAALRDEAIHIKIDNKVKIDEEKWKSADLEQRALQQQMRALELELARNYTRQDTVEHLFERFTNILSEQVKDIKEEVSTLTRHLLEQRSDHYDPTRRR